MKAASLWELLTVNVNICFAELTSNIGRTVITSLGIFLGVASLLVNVAFIRAMDSDIKRNLEEMGGLKIVTISQKDPVTSTEKREFQRSPGLTMEDLDSLSSRYSFIKSVLPQNEFRARLRSRANTFWAPAMAVSPAHLRVYNYQLESGSSFTSDHHVRKEAVCIIGKQAAERLLGRRANPLNQTISVNGKPFTIIGVIHTEDNFSYRSRQILIPYSSYTYHFRKVSGKLKSVALEITSSDKVQLATSQLHFAMMSMHRGINDMEVSANYVQIEEMRTAAMGMKILLGSIALISLLVGGISIMNIMFATIGDRIREIGIRKAIGAQGSDIFTQFIIETITLSLIGGVPGMVLGTVITFLPPDLLPIHPVLSGADYLLAGGFTVCTGILSGLFPALKAAGMQPVEALRY